MLIARANIYESTNRGDSLTNLGSVGGATVGEFFTGNSAMAYGGRLNGVPNADVFYVGAGTTITHRVILGGALTILNNYPGNTIRALTVDPQNYTHLFVLDTTNGVWTSFDEGVTWLNLTANLTALTTSARTIEVFSPSPTPLNTVLLVGGAGGVWQMRRPGSAGASWTLPTSGLPKVLVYDLRYDYTDNVLVAGTLGRGVWTLTNHFRGGGGTGVAQTPPTLVPPINLLTSQQMQDLPPLDEVQWPPEAVPSPE
jgi:hypothetical protein